MSLLNASGSGIDDVLFKKGGMFGRVLSSCPVLEVDAMLASSVGNGVRLDEEEASRESRTSVELEAAISGTEVIVTVVAKVAVTVTVILSLLFSLVTKLDSVEDDT